MANSYNNYLLVQKVKSLSFWVEETLPWNDRASFDFLTDMNVNLALLWKGSDEVRDGSLQRQGRGLSGSYFSGSYYCACARYFSLLESTPSLDGEVSQQKTLGSHQVRDIFVFARLTNLNQSNQTSHYGFVNKIVDKLVEETLPWNDKASFDFPADMKVNRNLTEEY